MGSILRNTRARPPARSPTQPDRLRDVGHGACELVFLEDARIRIDVPRQAYNGRSPLRLIGDLSASERAKDVGHIPARPAHFDSGLSENRYDPSYVDPL